MLWLTEERVCHTSHLENMPILLYWLLATDHCVSVGIPTLTLWMIGAFVLCHSGAMKAWNCHFFPLLFFEIWYSMSDMNVVGGEMPNLCILLKHRNQYISQLCWYDWLSLSLFFFFLKTLQVYLHWPFQQRSFTDPNHDRKMPPPVFPLIHRPSLTWQLVATVVILGVVC